MAPHAIFRVKKTTIFSCPPLHLSEKALKPEGKSDFQFFKKVEITEGVIRKMAKKAAKKTTKKKTTAKKATKKVAKKATKKATTKRKPNAKFMAPMAVSATLAEVVGNKPIPRTEVTKKLWAYIKKNGLQDAKERRNINADDKLKAVFGGKKTVSMFEMTKLVSKHLSALK